MTRVTNLAFGIGLQPDSPETLQPSALSAKEEVRPEIKGATRFLGRARFAASLVDEEPAEPRTV